MSNTTDAHAPIAHPVTPHRSLARHPTRNHEPTKSATSTMAVGTPHTKNDHSMRASRDNRPPLQKIRPYSEANYAKPTTALRPRLSFLHTCCHASIPTNSLLPHSPMSTSPPTTPTPSNNSFCRMRTPALGYYLNANVGLSDHAAFTWHISSPILAPSTNPP